MATSYSNPIKYTSTLTAKDVNGNVLSITEFAGPHEAALYDMRERDYSYVSDSAEGTLVVNLNAKSAPYVLILGDLY